jgi:hypothetical protein
MAVMSRVAVPKARVRMVSVLREVEVDDVDRSRPVIKELERTRAGCGSVSDVWCWVLHFGE